MLRLSLAVAVGAIALCGRGVHAAQLPPDVRAAHWAAPAVTHALEAGVLRLQSDGQFHGEAKVTREEAAIALGKLGRALVDGTWKPAGRSKAVPDSVSAIWDKTAWKTQPVRRYAFAAILARFGDYVANALPRPAATAKVGQSEVLSAVTVTLSSKSPAFESVTYLAHNRMIKPGSPLLKPTDTAPLLGADLSRALAELATGVSDKLTDLGKNPDGSTPDDAFHKAQRH
jgi:hypothetical protein